MSPESIELEKRVNLLRLHGNSHNLWYQWFIVIFYNVSIQTPGLTFFLMLFVQKTLVTKGPRLAMQKHCYSTRPREVIFLTLKGYGLNYTSLRLLIPLLYSVL